MKPYAYYNEHDPAAAAWLRELISAGEIAPGEVDERSICDVQPDDLVGYGQCHFFAGVGGWSAAFRLAGIADDEEAWSGSCPCQPFSAAGKQLGADDERHLWPEFYRLIKACRPAIVFGEQVASSAVIGSAKPPKRGALPPAECVWLDGIFTDLETAHYTCGASDIPAAGVGPKAFAEEAAFLRWCVEYGDYRVRGRESEILAFAAELDGIIHGAPHIRQRLWWVAIANGGCGHFSGPDARTTTGGLGNMQQPRLEGHSGHGGDRDEPGRVGTVAAGSAAQTGAVGDGMGDTSSGGCGEQRDAAWQGRSGHPERAGGAGQGPWGDYSLIPCRDGKVRRVPKPDVFAMLSDGLSADLDHLRIASHGHPLTVEKIKGRAALLRGPGNAIVSQVAAEFIRAVLSAID